MVRLLLILILLQMALPAHIYAQSSTDPDTAFVSYNLKNMSAAMASDKCVKVCEVRYNDYDGYNTITVFRYNVKAADSVFHPYEYLEKVPAKTTLVSIGPVKANTYTNTVYALRETGLNNIVYKVQLNDSVPLVPMVADFVSMPPKHAYTVNTDGMMVATGLKDVVYKIVVDFTIPQVLVDTALRYMPAAVPDATNTSYMLQSAGMLNTLISMSVPDSMAGVAIDATARYIPVSPIEDINTAGMLQAIAAATTTAKENANDALKNIDLKLPVETMHLSDQGYSLLQKLEGYAPSLYALGDGGYTIGFGFFVPFSEGYKYSKGVTWEQAEKMMRQKMPAYENQVKEYVNVPITQCEFDALTMLAYNIGGFAKATSIIDDVNEEADLSKLQSDWKKFIHSKAPNVSKGLINRRNDEMLVRRASNYQPERKIQIFKKK